MFNCIERKLYVFILFSILLFYNFMLKPNSLIIREPFLCFALTNVKKDIFCFVKAVKWYLRQNTGTFHKILRRVAQYEPPPPIQLGFEFKILLIFQ